MRGEWGQNGCTMVTYWLH